MELNGKTYWEAYDSLTKGLMKQIDEVKNSFHKKFLQVQIQRMDRWLEITEKIKA